MIRSPTPAPIHARRWADDDPVVLTPTRPERPIPLFGQDAWNLGCLQRGDNEGPVTLHFSDLEGEWRTTAKELMASRLNLHSFSSRRGLVRRGLTAGTCEAGLSSLKRVFRFMDALGVARVSDLVSDDLDEFKDLVGDIRGSKLSTSTQLNIFVWLYEDRDRLTHGGLAFDPWGGRATTKVAGHEASEENRTPRIPPPVMSGLLRMALHYVDDFADDIIAAARDFEGHSTPSVTPEVSEARFAAYVADLGKRGRGIPAIQWGGKVTASRPVIAARAGVDLSWFRFRGAEAIEAAWSALGHELEFLEPAKFVPEGWSEPWWARFSVEDMKVQCRNLTCAAYLVVAYLSGMRDSEVQDLRRGCLRVEVDEEGRVVRHRISGRTIKHRKDWLRREWVVIEPVARAIGVLEKLTSRYHERTGDDHLFVKLHYENDVGSPLRQRLAPGLRSLVSAWNELVGAREICAEAEGTPVPVPDHEGRPWNLTPSQFRRTLAWHIANQPFGEIAAMIQFGHAYIQITEGYCGSWEDGFANEVAKERSIARLGRLVGMLDDSARGNDPAGPMAPELQALFEQGNDIMGPFKGDRADDRQLRKLLRSKAHQLYAGVLADCFYVPDRARCQRGLATDASDEPSIGMCDPECENACWTKAHLPAWEHLEAEARRLRLLNRTSPLRNKVLRAQQEQAARVARAIREASPDA